MEKDGKTPHFQLQVRLQRGSSEVGVACVCATPVSVNPVLQWTRLKRLFGSLEGEGEGEKEMGSEALAETEKNRQASLRHFPLKLSPFPSPLIFRLKLRSYFFALTPLHTRKWGLCEYVIVHTFLATQPVILWIELGSKPKWLPLNTGYRDVMRTTTVLTIFIFSYVLYNMYRRTPFLPPSQSFCG